jgi:hypothetical protein
MFLYVKEGERNIIIIILFQNIYKKKAGTGEDIQHNLEQRLIFTSQTKKKQIKLSMLGKNQPIETTTRGWREASTKATRKAEKTGQKKKTRYGTSVMMMMMMITLHRIEKGHD